MPKKFPQEFKLDVVRVARRGDLSIAEVADEEESSGGETRTLNLAVNSRLLCRLSYPGTRRLTAFRR
jgi:hypothetical protein